MAAAQKVRRKYNKVFKLVFFFFPKSGPFWNKKNNIFGAPADSIFRTITTEDVFRFSSSNDSDCLSM